ncbi:MAG: GGDEF domain-containing protein [Lachnospiraceae bacterium]|nr:GGDEF domain-containing protein [Lachnospiraceae bacterium]
MYYASFGLLALILHLIINTEILRKKAEEINSVAIKRYRNFLYIIMLYYITDVLWGLLIESGIVVLAYADTVLYFVSMAMAVLVWTRFVVEYTGRRGLESVSLIYAGWVIFAFTLISLAINFITPVIFTIDANRGYVPGVARYFIFIILFLLQTVLSIYSVFVSVRSEGKDRIHYATIAASGAGMAFFIVLQTLYPLLPFYAVGCLVSTCLIHVFVEGDERQEMDERLHMVEKKAKSEEMKNITFGQIAESLASNYDSIYYVNANDSSYAGFSAKNDQDGLTIDRTGEDFFTDTKENIPKIIHPQDQVRLVALLDRDYLLSALEDRKMYTVTYRITEGERAGYTRMSVRKTSDSAHFIIGVENIDDEIRKEHEHVQALNTERELARRDELTGTRNKTAYFELEESVQKSIESGMEEPSFAIAIFDINDLKKVNDEEGHKAGDDYIKSAAKLICDTFDHSPVFRIGGDEFVIFMQGDDYNDRDDLMLRFHEQILENILNGHGPIIASGMAEFIPGSDKSVSSVFERADDNMYNDKRDLKRSGNGYSDSINIR